MVLEAFVLVHTLSNCFKFLSINWKINADGGSGSMVPAKRKRMASEAEKEKPLQSAISFTSKNPFFMVTLRPSYVTSNSGVVTNHIYLSISKHLRVLAHHIYVIFAH